MDQLRDGLPAQSGAPAGRRPPLRHSLRDQVLCALRGALVSGELCPGTVYSAPALAARFEVSATPVREAMQQLVREGAVEVVHNRGFRVASRSVRDLAELAEVRALLEIPVLLRLARTVAPGYWKELRPLALATADAVGDPAAYAAADRAFHTALLGLDGNAQLVAVAGELHGRAQWPAAQAPGPHPARLLADAAEHAAEHTALLDALAARDLPAVESLARDHLTGTRRG